MTEKEWMEDVKKRLEQEESFLINNVFFGTGNVDHTPYYVR